ncbi:MAG: hypothetical protein M3383_01960, partial [Actinomycetota bacterium]|nr:hypothetical protein [Actinomycetota bacterium]
LKALGGLAGEYADKALISTAAGVHTGITGRVFAFVTPATGPTGRMVRATHDAITNGVYEALRRGGNSFGAAIGALADVVDGAEERGSVSASRFGRGLQAAINGLIGDRLEEEENPLAVRMALRKPGRDLEMAREALQDAFSEPTDRLAIFIHGLCETEEAWWLGTRSEPGRDTGDDAEKPRTYGERLRHDLGFTPLYLRYNSGLHISENGRRLSWLLEDLVREWPVPVTEIALVGHSMGGLVARSACHEADDATRAWLGLTEHVISLAAPNTGSWLEKTVNVGGWAMRKLPEARPFADFLELRSAGIQDLRFGYVSDQDWADRDPHERLRNHALPQDPTPGIAYHFVSGGLTSGERHPVATVFGDVLVRRQSATSPLTASGDPAGDTRHVQGASHFSMLNHPRVYEHVREWLADSVAAGVEVVGEALA